MGAYHTPIILRHLALKPVCLFGKSEMKLQDVAPILNSRPQLHIQQLFKCTLTGSRQEEILKQKGAKVKDAFSVQVRVTCIP